MASPRRLLLLIVSLVFFATVLGADRPGYTDLLWDPAQHRWWQLLSASWLAPVDGSFEVFALALGFCVLTPALLHHRVSSLVYGFFLGQSLAALSFFAWHHLLGPAGEWAGALAWLAAMAGFVGTQSPMHIRIFDWTLGTSRVIAALVGVVALGLPMAMGQAGLARTVANFAALCGGAVVGAIVRRRTKPQLAANARHAARPSHLKVVRSVNDLLN